MRAWRTFASAASESVTALEPYMQLFNQSHPSWPWFLGTLLTTGGGVCTGFHYIVKSQLHPVVRDVDKLVENTQEISKNQQRLELSVERAQKDTATGFDRLNEQLAKFTDR